MSIESLAKARMNVIEGEKAEVEKGVRDELEAAV